MLHKGEKELNMIVTLIILLVLAVVVISLMLTFLKPDAFDKPYKEQLELTQAKLVCDTACTNIGSATGFEKDKRIWDYCVTNKALIESEYTDLIIRGAGSDAFCRDKAYCFNIDNNECFAGGKRITAEVCGASMCKFLISEGKTQSEAEQRIKQEMQSGSCTLKEGAQIQTPSGTQSIIVKTWWEKYFENPDCSEFTGNGSGGGSSGGQCDSYCNGLGKDYSGATSESCINVAQCDDPGVPELDAPFCSDLEVCCCKA